MFFEKIQHIDSNKDALRLNGLKFTYGDILAKAKQRAGFFENKNVTFLLCHHSELENLLNFFAILAVGGKAIFGGKNLSNEQKYNVSLLHNATIIDFVPESSAEIKDFYNPTPNTYFLGVLTSGSTGQSKVIWKDYQSWFSAFPHQSSVFGITELDNVFVLDALAYSANLNTVLHTLWQGATVIMGRLAEASSWTCIFNQNDVTSAFLVPSHLRLLTENYSFKELNIKSLVSAGEKLNVDLAQYILDTFPNILLTEYYGAAELGHISFAQNQEIVNNPFSLGMAFPGVSIEIKKEKIFVDSPYISPDFRGIRTVYDLGFLDADGRLSVLGRQGRMFNRRGLNIFALEIENAALSHPWVKEAVLIANHQRPKVLELIVVLRKEISKSELKAFLLQKITKDKLPNRIIFSASLPRNESGKVDFGVIGKKPVDEDSFA